MFIGQGSPEKQDNRIDTDISISMSMSTSISISISVYTEREREREKEIYYERLAHMTMEVEKFHHLPSASWRLRKASGVVLL